MIGRIVLVAVGEDQSHVVGKFFTRPVLPGVHFRLDRSQVHRLLDDFVIVVQTEPGRVHRFVERPRVARVFLREQLLENLVTIFERLAQLGLGIRHIDTSAARVQGGQIARIFSSSSVGLFDLTARLPACIHLAGKIFQHRISQRVRRVGFPLDGFPCLSGRGLRSM
uniref:Uncharacterized protein n=1 Tax=Cacopsylla melanoneura TaxID=428564 RepID=A0A8D8UCY6_9HEMI